MTLGEILSLANLGLSGVEVVDRQVGGDEQCIDIDTVKKLLEGFGWKDERKKYKEKLEFTEKFARAFCKLSNNNKELLNECSVEFEIKPSEEYGKNVFRAVIDSGYIHKMSIVVGAKNSGGKYCCYFDGSPITDCKASTLAGLVGKIDKKEISLY